MKPAQLDSEGRIQVILCPPPQGLSPVQDHVGQTKSLGMCCVCVEEGDILSTCLLPAYNTLQIIGGYKLGDLSQWPST